MLISAMEKTKNHNTKVRSHYQHKNKITEHDGKTYIISAMEIKYNYRI